MTRPTAAPTATSPLAPACFLTLHFLPQKDGFDAKAFGRTYYPAKLWHERAPSDKPKAPDGVPRVFGDFYVVQALRVWERMKLGCYTVHFQIEPGLL